VRLRVEKLLRQLPRSRVAPSRAVAVLENIGSAEARRVLTSLTRGTPEAFLTQQSQAALWRLARRNEGGR